MVSAGSGLGQAFLVPEKNGKYTIMTSPLGMSWNRSFYFSCKKHIQEAV
jgi:hypothetical protein